MEHFQGWILCYATKEVSTIQKHRKLCQDLLISGVKLENSIFFVINTQITTLYTLKLKEVYINCISINLGNKTLTLILQVSNALSVLLSSSKIFKFSMSLCSVSTYTLQNYQYLCTNFWHHFSVTDNIFPYCLRSFFILVRNQMWQVQLTPHLHSFLLHSDLSLERELQYVYSSRSIFYIICIYICVIYMYSICIYFYIFI